MSRLFPLKSLAASLIFSAMAMTLQAQAVGQPLKLSASLQELILGSEWKLVDERSIPALFIPDHAEAVPLHIEVIDALSGSTHRISEGDSSIHQDWMRWSGRTDDIRWHVLLRDHPGGGVELSLHLAADRDRPVQVRVGYEIAPGSWQWHDGLDRSRPWNAESATLSHPEVYPAAGVAFSRLPFGVISRDQHAFIVANDPIEPRAFTIEADAARSFFGLVYDMGLTQLTHKFPGEAALRLHLWHRPVPLPSSSAMRHALASYYQRFPDIFENRLTTMGAWAPYVDAGTLPGRNDFGAMIPVLPPGTDLTGDGDQDATFLYTEPWFYWLPIPEDQPRDDATVAIQLASRASNGSPMDRAFANAAIHGSARQLNHQPVHVLLNTPWNNGARIAVSSDPDFGLAESQAIRRAAIEQQIVDAHPPEAGWNGIFLDSLFGLTHRDFGERALASADYPALMDKEHLQAYTLGAFSAMEWVSWLHHHVSGNGQHIIGNGALRLGGIFSAYMDGYFEELISSDDFLLDHVTGTQAEIWRMLAGPRLISTGLMTDFSTMTRQDLADYFRHCLRFGFVPGLHSENGYHNMYWRNPAWYHRDRELFRLFMPVIQRLAAAGWSPVTDATPDDSRVRVESFGDDESTRLYSLFNSSPDFIRTGMAMDIASPYVAIRPLNGWVQWKRLDDQSPSAVTLAPGEVDALIVCPADELDGEIARYADHHPVRKNLISLAREISIGLDVSVDIPSPILRGNDARIDVAFFNHGTQEVRIADIAMQGALRRRSSSDSSFTLATNSGRTVSIRLRANDLKDDPALVLTWSAQTATSSFQGIRQLQPNYMDAEPERSASRPDAVADDAPTGNLLLMPGVRVRTTGTESGYRVDHLHNRLTRSEGRPWTEVSWRSIRRMDEHRITIDFPRPVRVDRVVIYWGADAQRAYPPREGRITALRNDGQEVLLAHMEPDEQDKQTVVSFHPVTVKTLSILQPPLSGPSIAPMIMWLNELEVLGSDPAE